MVKWFQYFIGNNNNNANNMNAIMFMPMNGRRLHRRWVDDVLERSLSGTDRGGDVCGFKEEEIDNSKLFYKVLQSYARLNTSAQSNSAKLIHEVKEILVEHFTNVK